MVADGMAVAPWAVETRAAREMMVEASNERVAAYEQQYTAMNEKKRESDNDMIVFTAPSGS